jgi:hypothetical protein
VLRVLRGGTVRRALARQSDSLTVGRFSGFCSKFILQRNADYLYNAAVNEMENESIRRWLPGWRTAAPVLERLRAEAIRRSDTAAAIEQLSDAFESALRHYPPEKTTGLVEQQRLFARWRL